MEKINTKEKRRIRELPEDKLRVYAKFSQAAYRLHLMIDRGLNEPPEIPTLPIHPALEEDFKIVRKIDPSAVLAYIPKTSTVDGRLELVPEVVRPEFLPNIKLGRRRR